jgi:serine phosphatase RsbU (regulator of sigma subunit)/Tfp pilus assembly protein PilF
MHLTRAAYLLYGALLLIIPLTASGQRNRLIDSLEAVVASLPGDTIKTKRLNDLAWQYRDISKEKAYQRANEALKLATTLQFKKGIAYSHSVLGILFTDEGNYVKGLDHQLKALEISEQMGSKPKIASSYNNVAYVYMAMGNQDLALKYYNKALGVSSAINDSMGLSLIHNNIGAIHYKRKQYDTALYYYERSRLLSELLLDSSSLSISYVNIGNVHLEKKNYEKALECQNKALYISELIDDNILSISPLSNLGEIYSKTGKYETALEYYRKALKYALRSNHVTSLLDIYEGMSLTYESLNDPVNALKYYRMYSAKKDSVITTENSKQMAEMQTRFETEKKEKEIQVLTEKANVQELESRKQKQLLNFSLLTAVLVAITSVVLFSRYKVKQKANSALKKAYDEIEVKNRVVEEKNKNIMDSLHYARRIQRTIIPNTGFMKQHLPSYFVLYKPRDIVSGDFYWCTKINGKVLLATADCTGHGVPGAFMSVMGASLLNEIIVERGVTRPDVILNHLREGIIKSLNPEGSEEEFKDGMDIVICSYDLENLTLQFAGANNPLWIAKTSGELVEYKGDKFPVGKLYGELKPFTLKEIALEKGDTIYTFTDGYADQFGGPLGKKFKNSQLKELLGRHHRLPMQDQQQELEKALDQWKGEMEQVDDILLIGVRV